MDFYFDMSMLPIKGNPKRQNSVIFHKRRWISWSQKKEELISQAGQSALLWFRTPTSKSECTAHTNAAAEVSVDSSAFLDQAMHSVQRKARNSESRNRKTAGLSYTSQSFLPIFNQLCSTCFSIEGFCSPSLFYFKPKHTAQSLNYGTCGASTSTQTEWGTWGCLEWIKSP